MKITELLNEAATVTINGKRVDLPGGGSFNYTTPSSSSRTYRAPTSSSYPHTNTSPPISDRRYRTPSNKVIRWGDGISEAKKNIFKEALADVKRILYAKGVGWVTDGTFYFGSPENPEWGGMYRYSDDITHIPRHLAKQVAIENILHELGHRFHYQCRDTYAFDREVNAMYKYYLTSGHKAFMREYGKKDRYEFWADSFELWAKNQIQNYHQAAWVSAMIKKYNR
jgi:hypothetical protein